MMNTSARIVACGRCSFTVRKRRSLCGKASGPANKQSGNADNYRCVVESYALLATKDLVDDLLGP